jgi:DNA-nicking Smr family endonuclease
MKSKKIRKLDENETKLWHEVKKTVSPLVPPTRKSTESLKDSIGQPDAGSGRDGILADDKGHLLPITKPQAGKTTAPSYSPPISTRSLASGLPSRLDDHTARKLSKGRLDIDDRIDLHGMTQNEAHARLHQFLFSCQGRGSRIVLVITGKGRHNDGVLKTLVPNWLREPQMAVFVSGFRESAISHGGSGALYVRIRRLDRKQGK